jgi:hypothetical protein
MNVKAGWKTTEFWVVVIAAVLSIAVAGGYITVEESEAINNAIVQTIDAVTNLIGVLLPIVYVWSRTKVKTS